MSRRSGPPARRGTILLAGALVASAAGCHATTATSVATTTATATATVPSTAGPAPPDTAQAPTSTTTTAATTTTAVVVDLETIGRSVMGRPILAGTLAGGPTRVLVLGGIHGDERAGSDIAPLLLDHLAAAAPETLTIRLVLDANPDGTVAATRGNRNGVDLNRNWPTADFAADPIHGPEPLSEPETAALAADVAAFDPTLIVALHSTWDGPFVNYDGPGAALAEACAGAASAHDGRWTMVPQLDWSTPGSMGTYFGKERGIPVITLEPNRYDAAAQVWPAARDCVDDLLRLFARWRAGDVE